MTDTKIEEVASSTTVDLPPINELNLETIMNYDYSGISEFIVSQGLKLLTALLIFLIGKWIVKRLVNLLDRFFEKGGLDRTLGDFIENIAYAAGMVAVVIAALAHLGIETTSFAAMIAAAGLAIGLALQGSLSNFAAGFLIIFFRPFKAGDYVEVAGIGGVVEEISIFTTQLLTPDNRFVVIPNNNITTDTIVNYSAKRKRRIDLVIGVSYTADLQKAQKIIKDVLKKNKSILDTPESVVEVDNLGESSVDFVVRPWVKTNDYWPTKWALMKEIKIQLDKAEIGIPFPQRDVNLFIHDGEIPVVDKASSKKKTSKTKK